MNSQASLTFSSMLKEWRETLKAVRLLLTDAIWAEIEPRLAGIKHKAGSPPELSDRLFIEAVLYIAHTGVPWRDMPREFGHWDAIYNPPLTLGRPGQLAVALGMPPTR
jgi:transposase